MFGAAQLFHVRLSLQQAVLPARKHQHSAHVLLRRALSVPLDEHGGSPRAHELNVLGNVVSRLECPTRHSKLHQLLDVQLVP